MLRYKEFEGTVKLLANWREPTLRGNSVTLPILPVLLLLTAVGSIVLYQRTALDIFKVLTAGTAIICLIWGLIIAHWSIHLLSLIVLLKFKSPLRLVQVEADK